MAKTQERIITRKVTEEQGIRPPAAECVRERLLTGLPVTERRLHLAGVSTEVDPSLAMKRATGQLQL